MKGLSKGVELIRFGRDPDDSDWYVAQLACDGTLGVAFSTGVDTVSSYLQQGESYLGEYLERQARSLISRYGDARNPRPDPIMTGESRV